MSTYQASPQCIDGVSCELSDDMVLVTVTILVDMLNDAERDLGEVQFANHCIANCIVISKILSKIGGIRTFVERHIFAFNLSAGIASIRHVIHKDIHVATRARKLAVDEFEHEKTRF